MYLKYYLDEQGNRVYTLKKQDPIGCNTFSAHPARFSPEDNFIMRQLFFSYFGLRRRVRQLRRTKFIRPMRTYEEAVKLRLLLNGIIFLVGWSFVGWKVITSVIIVDEKTGEEKVAFAQHLKKRQAEVQSMNILEHLTGQQRIPLRAPVEICKTEFPADELT